MATRQKPADDTRDVELLDQLARARSALVEQIGRRIVGQHKIGDDLVAALLAGGHVLLVGVPQSRQGRGAMGSPGGWGW